MFFLNTLFLFLYVSLSVSINLSLSASLYQSLSFYLLFLLYNLILIHFLEDLFRMKIHISVSSFYFIFSSIYILLCCRYFFLTLTFFLLLSFLTVDQSVHLLFFSFSFFHPSLTLFFLSLPSSFVLSLICFHSMLANTAYFFPFCLDVLLLFEYF